MLKKYKFFNSLISLGKRPVNLLFPIDKDSSLVNCFMSGEISPSIAHIRICNDFRFSSENNPAGNLPPRL